MFKLVIWNNEESQFILEKFKDRTDVLIISAKEQNLKWSELTLPQSVISNLTENVDLVFSGHGSGDNATCSYDLINVDGEVTAFRSIDVISEIFKPFIENSHVNLHMMSCHAGMVLDELVHQTQVNIADGRWLNHSIFLHGGTITIRGLRTREALEVIDNTDRDGQEISAYRNFNLFEKLYISTPGDLTYIQIPDFAYKAPLVTSSNFIGHNLVNLEQHLTQDWAQIRLKINEYADENNITHKLAATKQVNLFNYLKSSFKHGADCFYELEFVICIGVLDGKLVKVDDDKVTKYVDDLYSLVEASHLTKAQFDELIAIQFFFHSKNISYEPNLKITFPQGLELKLTTAHEELFKKGLDVTQVKHGDITFLESLMWSNYPINAIKATLNMTGIKCSDLNSNSLLKNIGYIKSAQELLPTILERLEQKIDLNAKDSEGNSLLDQIKYLEIFKEHYKLILEKSYPVENESSLADAAWSCGISESEIIGLASARNSEFDPS